MQSRQLHIKENVVLLLPSTRNVKLEEYDVPILDHIRFTLLFILSSSLTDNTLKETEKWLGPKKKPTISTYINKDKEGAMGMLDLWWHMVEQNT